MPFYRQKKGEDKFTRRDLYQSVLGASSVILTTFLILTITAPSIRAGVSLFMVVLMMTIFGILAVRGEKLIQKPMRLLLYILTSFFVSYVISALVGFVYLQGFNLSTLASVEYLKSIPFVATVNGMFAGAITDATMN